MSWIALAVLGLGLVLVLEGLVYALFPGAMKRFMARALEMPEETLRTAGLVAAAVGLALIALAAP